MDNSNSNSNSDSKDVKDIKQELKSTLQELNRLIDMTEQEIYEGCHSGTLTNLWQSAGLSIQLDQVKKIKESLVSAVKGKILSGSAVFVKMTALDDFISMVEKQGKTDLVTQANKLKKLILEQHDTYFIK